MRVLVIPEDFRKDQYVLKPLVEALFAFLNKPRAIVRVCQDPLLGGISQAIRWEKINGILDRYRGMVEIFLLIVDRDGDETRKARLTELERRASIELGEARLFGENAWQEVEVWALAGHDLPPAWSWDAIRRENNPKETYFVPFAEMKALLDEPGQGRKALAQVAASRYSRVRQLCKEDIGVLEERIKAYLMGA